MLDQEMAQLIGIVMLVTYLLETVHQEFERPEFVLIHIIR